MSLTNLLSSDIIVKKDLFNQAVTANTNILTTGLSLSQSPLAFFLIYCTFQATGALSITRTKNNTTVTEILNNNVSLVANAAQVFVFPVSDNETINIKYSSSTTASKIIIVELMAGVFS